MTQTETVSAIDELRSELINVLATAIADLGSVIGIEVAIEQAITIVDSLP